MRRTVAATPSAMPAARPIGPFRFSFTPASRIQLGHRRVGQRVAQARGAHRRSDRRAALELCRARPAGRRASATTARCDAPPPRAPSAASATRTRRRPPPAPPPAPAGPRRPAAASGPPPRTAPSPAPPRARARSGSRSLAPAREPAASTRTAARASLESSQRRAAVRSGVSVPGHRGQNSGVPLSRISWLVTVGDLPDRRPAAPPRRLLRLLAGACSPWAPPRRSTSA